MKEPKLAEIAARIDTHLKRMEADPKVNALRAGRKINPYFCAGAWAAGRYVGVRYVSFQGEDSLTKAEALAYLAWLDAGNNGKHWLRAAARARAALAVLEPQP